MNVESVEDVSLADFLDEYDGIHSVTLDELESMHYEKNLTHEDLAERFDTAVAEVARRLSNLKQPRLCDCCRGEIGVDESKLQFCSSACQELSKTGTVECPDCGEEIHTVGRWKAHTHEEMPDYVLEQVTNINNHDRVSWKKQRTEALHRAGGECEVCGAGDDIEVHHIVPRRFFDSQAMHAMENLVVLCRSCHSEHERKSLRELFKKVIG